MYFLGILVKELVRDNAVVTNNYYKLHYIFNNNNSKSNHKILKEVITYSIKNVS